MNIPEIKKQLTEAEREKARAASLRFDGFVQAALMGLLANPAYNSVEWQKYAQMKKLTIEQLAVASAAETIVQINKFYKGEVGGDDESTQNDLKSGFSV